MNYLITYKTTAGTELFATCDEFTTGLAAFDAAVASGEYVDVVFASRRGQVLRKWKG